MNKQLAADLMEEDNIKELIYEQLDEESKEFYKKKLAKAAGSDKVRGHRKYVVMLDEYVFIK